MDQIYNPEEIIKKAENMAEQSAALRKQIQRMATIVEEIGGVWSSPAQSRFSSKFEEIKTPLLNFCKQIDDFATNATTQAKNVLTVEAE